ncbi:MAG: hypothetical protein LKE64_11940 [Solobacterium sp.]|jgi:hypothetical protein|nr:hypothetical protein [Solobacterium sp.]MCH4047968.1 hypothetical protein [Solobacterium sp.]MCH4075446.1 hypothetical protein [Solobacterium sp.]MCI1314562.1 hypothetical protein [Solobacterium sp.]MCI1346765.1 hypothetical protein [Solobacterium sp.]
MHSKKQNPVIIYLIFSIFLLVFSIIYEHFSFGVISYAMVFLSAYPFVLGFLPSLFVRLRSRPDLPRFYHDGVLCMTFGSLLQGIFEIYGTSSFYTVWFYYIGAAALVISLIFYIKRLHM